MSAGRALLLPLRATLSVVGGAGRVPTAAARRIAQQQHSKAPTTGQSSCFSCQAAGPCPTFSRRLGLVSRSLSAPQSRPATICSAAKEGTMGKEAETIGIETNPDPETQEYIMQQTMYRIKDPIKSMEFYTGVLGMRLLKRFDYPSGKFSLYFMGYADPADIPAEDQQRAIWTFRQKGTLELTHNWGTENDPDFHYHNGNSEPKGFGHIGVVVPDVYKASERFERLGVKFVKTPDGGSMKGLAFIQDPDGYWIEILSTQTVKQF